RKPYPKGLDLVLPFGPSSPPRRTVPESPMRRAEKCLIGSREQTRCDSRGRCEVSHPSMLRGLRARFRGPLQALTLLVVRLLAGGDAMLLAQQAPAPAATTGTTPPAEGGDSAQLKPEDLEQLVAPIALYPDDLLAQCLVASTYPVEVIQAQQWLD